MTRNQRALVPGRVGGDIRRGRGRAVRVGLDRRRRSRYRRARTAGGRSPAALPWPGAPAPRTWSTLRTRCPSSGCRCVMARSSGSGRGCGSPRSPRRVTRSRTCPTCLPTPAPASGRLGEVSAGQVRVYCAAGYRASQATTGSLLVVGVTALVGAVTAYRSGNVLLTRGLAFGAIAIGGAVAGAKASGLVGQPVLLARRTARRQAPAKPARPQAAPNRAPEAGDRAERAPRERAR